MTILQGVGLYVVGSMGLAVLWVAACMAGRAYTRYEQRQALAKRLGFPPVY